MKTPIIIAATFALCSCGGNQQKASDPLADSGRTQLTENLLTNLKALGDSSVYMFGHHDDTVYGIGWQADYLSDSTVHQRSDVRSVCGDFPALLSFDLGHIELGDTLNLDGVPFSRIRQEILAHYDRGGMVTLSWHLNNPLSGGTSWVADSLRDVETHTVAAVLEGGERHEQMLAWLDRVADFLNSLTTPYGVRVPVLFRPWHEHTGSWFWWGSDHCTPEQYKALWQLTVSRLRERGVVNALLAYSPGTEPDGNAEKYLERYPGDDIIDLMGLDCYCQQCSDNVAADSNAETPVPVTTLTLHPSPGVALYMENLDKNLEMVCNVAREHGKAAALTETGCEGLRTPDWWTHALAPVLARHPVSYVLVWRNAHDRPGHFFAPYPGQQSASDFVNFYNLKATLFLHDLNGLYLSNH